MLQTTLQLLFLLSLITATFQCDRNLVPSMYEVTFRPDFDTMEVNGELYASIIVLKASDTITLDKLPGTTINDLQVSQARRTFQFKSLDENYEYGLKYRVVLNETLDENEFFNFRLKFSYKSDETSDGFYIGEMSPAWREYESHGKQFAASYLAVSGCQAAFPCINCPLDGVYFKIHITTPCSFFDCNYTTVSSTNIIETNSITFGNTITYSETPKLSYRNLALFVSPFQPIEIVDQVIYSRIWGKNDESVVAFGTAAQKSMNFFETFFNVRLPYQLKHVVVPDKFYPENVAAYYSVIFYKEPYMAVDYDLLREEKRRKISGAVSRQFFTNFRHDIFEFGQFTAEAFGKYFEYIEILTPPQWEFHSSHGFKYVPSKWQISDIFTIDVLQTAMETHKDEASVLYKPSKARTMLLRSAAFLRFFEHLITTPDFVKTLKNIVKRPVVMTDIQILEVFKPYFDKQLRTNGTNIQYHENVYKMMKTPGYPVLTVSHEHLYGEPSIILTQQWYTQFPHQPSDKLFQIPVSFSIIGESFEKTRPDFLFTNKTGRIPCKIISCKLAIFNTQQTGFYRVNYDPLTWIHVIKNLQTDHTSIHVLNRAQLIDDAFALADGELLSYQIPLKLSLYLRKENSVGPWIAFFRGIRSVELWFKYCGKQIATTLFENYVHDLIVSAFGKSFAQVLAPSEEQIRLMSLALPYLCKYNSVVCQTIAHKVFLSKNIIQPDICLLDSVYCWALKFEHPMADWLELRAKYKKSVLIGDEVAMKVYRKAVACGKKNNEVMWFLNYAVVQGFEGNEQEATDIFLEVIESAENGYRLTLRYLTANIHNVYHSIYLPNVLLKLAEVTFLPSQVVEFSYLVKQVVNYTNVAPIMRQLQRNGIWSARHSGHITNFLESEHFQQRLQRLITLKRTAESTMKHKFKNGELIAVLVTVFFVSFTLLNAALKVTMCMTRLMLTIVRVTYRRLADATECSMRMVLTAAIGEVAEETEEELDDQTTKQSHEKTEQLPVAIDQNGPEQADDNQDDQPVKQSPEEPEQLAVPVPKEQVDKDQDDQPTEQSPDEPEPLSVPSRQEDEHHAFKDQPSKPFEKTEQLPVSIVQESQKQADEYQKIQPPEQSQEEIKQLLVPICQNGQKKADEDQDDQPTKQSPEESKQLPVSVHKEAKQQAGDDQDDQPTEQSREEPKQFSVPILRKGQQQADEDQEDTQQLPALVVQKTQVQVGESQEIQSPEQSPEEPEQLPCTVLKERIQQADEDQDDQPTEQSLEEMEQLPVPVRQEGEQNADRDQDNQLTEQSPEPCSLPLRQEGQDKGNKDQDDLPTKTSSEENEQLPVPIIQGSQEEADEDQDNQPTEQAPEVEQLPAPIYQKDQQQADKDQNDQPKEQFPEEHEPLSVPVHKEDKQADEDQDDQPPEQSPEKEEPLPVSVVQEADEDQDDQPTEQLPEEVEQLPVLIRQEGQHQANKDQDDQSTKKSSEKTEQLSMPVHKVDEADEDHDDQPPEQSPEKVEQLSVPMVLESKQQADKDQDDQPTEQIPEELEQLPVPIRKEDQLHADKDQDDQPTEQSPEEPEQFPVPVLQESKQLADEEHEPLSVPVHKEDKQADEDQDDQPPEQSPQKEEQLTVPVVQEGKQQIGDDQNDQPTEQVLEEVEQLPVPLHQEGEHEANKDQDDQSTKKPSEETEQFSVPVHKEDEADRDHDDQPPEQSPEKVAQLPVPVVRESKQDDKNQDDQPTEQTPEELEQLPVPIRHEGQHQAVKDQDDQSTKKSSEETEKLPAPVRQEDQLNADKDEDDQPKEQSPEEPEQFPVVQESKQHADDQSPEQSPIKVELVDEEGKQQVDDDQDDQPTEQFPEELEQLTVPIHQEGEHQANKDQEDLPKEQSPAEPKSSSVPSRQEGQLLADKDQDDQPTNKSSEETEHIPEPIRQEGEHQADIDQDDQPTKKSEETEQLSAPIVQESQEQADEDQEIEPMEQCPEVCKQLPVPICQEGQQQADKDQDGQPTEQFLEEPKESPVATGEDDQNKAVEKKDGQPTDRSSPVTLSLPSSGEYSLRSVVSDQAHDEAKDAPLIMPIIEELVHELDVTLAILDEDDQHQTDEKKVLTEQIAKDPEAISEKQQDQVEDRGSGVAQKIPSSIGTEEKNKTKEDQKYQSIEQYPKETEQLPTVLSEEHQGNVEDENYEQPTDGSSSSSFSSCGEYVLGDAEQAQAEDEEKKGDEKLKKKPKVKSPEKSDVAVIKEKEKAKKKHKKKPKDNPPKTPKQSPKGIRDEHIDKPEEKKGEKLKEESEEEVWQLRVPLDEDDKDKVQEKYYREIKKESTEKAVASNEASTHKAKKKHKKKSKSKSPRKPEKSSVVTREEHEDQPKRSGISGAADRQSATDQQVTLKGKRRSGVSEATGKDHTEDMEAGPSGLRAMQPLPETTDKIFETDDDDEFHSDYDDEFERLPEAELKFRQTRLRKTLALRKIQQDMAAKRERERDSTFVPYMEEESSVVEEKGTAKARVSAEAKDAARQAKKMKKKCPKPSWETPSDEDNERAARQFDKATGAITKTSFRPSEGGSKKYTGTIKKVILSKDRRGKMQSENESEKSTMTEVPLPPEALTFPPQASSEPLIQRPIGILQEEKDKFYIGGAFGELKIPSEYIQESYETKLPHPEEFLLNLFLKITSTTEHELTNYLNENDAIENSLRNPEPSRRPVMVESLAIVLPKSAESESEIQPGNIDNSDADTIVASDVEKVTGSVRSSAEEITLTPIPATENEPKAASESIGEEAVKKKKKKKRKKKTKKESEPEAIRESMDDSATDSDSCPETAV